MLEDLKEQVLQANLELNRRGLVLYTWGNVSGIDRERQVIAIKPSGVPYEEMTQEDIVLIDFTGRVLEGRLNPSSDAPTHIELYKKHDAIRGVCHTHSRWATIYAQAGRAIPPYGTTHADYFYGPVPCTRELRKEEIETSYERNTGRVIIETLETLEPEHMPAVLVKNHAPFTWGKDAAEAVYHAAVLEEVACMSWILESGCTAPVPLPAPLLWKHFSRKHGPDASYGQGN